MNGSLKFFIYSLEQTQLHLHPNLKHIDVNGMVPYLPRFGAGAVLPWETSLPFFTRVWGRGGLALLANLCEYFVSIHRASNFSNIGQGVITIIVTNRGGQSNSKKVHSRLLNSIRISLLARPPIKLVKTSPPFLGGGGWSRVVSGVSQDLIKLSRP